MKAILAKHKEEQEYEKEVFGPDYEDGELVFRQVNGRRLDPNNITGRQFPRLCDKAGVPRIRFHDLRHTHASLMMMNGTPPKVVSDRLGHSGIGITMDLYSHVLPEAHEEAAAKFDELMWKPNPTSPRLRQDNVVKLRPKKRGPRQTS